MVLLCPQIPAARLPRGGVESDEVERRGPRGGGGSGGVGGYGALRAGRGGRWLAAGKRKHFAWKVLAVGRSRRAPVDDESWTRIRMGTGGEELRRRSRTELPSNASCSCVVAPSAIKVFALMFDAPWAAVQSCFGPAAAVLGSDCALEPSLFIWSLRHNVDPRDRQPSQPAPTDAPTETSVPTGAGDDDMEEKRTAFVGQNFGLPHRDFSYSEAHFPSGAPKVRFTGCRHGILRSSCTPSFLLLSNSIRNPPCLSVSLLPTPLFLSPPSVHHCPSLPPPLRS